jgi:glycosyltransferase involved in cell wall biosynthesis
MISATDNVSVIICAYTEDRWDNLIAAVESVRRQTLPPCEIIVVIDYNPHLLKRAQEHLLDVVLVENRRSRGISGARNSGIAVAKGNIIAFLDDDAIAEPNWIEQLVVCYADPHIAGVGGKIAPFWREARPSWLPDELDWVVGCTYRGMPLKARAARNREEGIVRNMIGANMSLRRDVLISINGFHESLGRGARGIGYSWLQRDVVDDDTEVCMRVTQQYPNCAKFYFTPTAIVWHSVPAQRACWSYFFRRSYAEGLAKAMLVGMHGAHMGLSSERSYTFKTLPLGMIRGVSDALLHRDPAGLARAGAIVAAFMATLSGYVVGSVVTKIKKLYLLKSSQRREAQQDQAKLTPGS